jgi:hypothetical protein
LYKGGGGEEALRRYGLVNEDPDAWFNEKPRPIPANQVAIDRRGELTSSASLAALESPRWLITAVPTLRVRAAEP